MMRESSVPEQKARGKGAMLIWTAAGTFFLALGLIGVALPLLPTTPFLLLAAACYLRGSERMYRWLLTNRLFGKYLDDYRERRGVPRKVKVAGIAVLWTTMGLTALFAVSESIIQIVLIAVAFFVTVHIVTIKTKNPG